jgi:hypothetical protein
MSGDLEEEIISLRSLNAELTEVLAALCRDYRDDSYVWDLAIAVLAKSRDHSNV